MINFTWRNRVYYNWKKEVSVYSRNADLAWQLQCREKEAGKLTDYWIIQLLPFILFPSPCSFYNSIAHSAPTQHVVSSPPLSVVMFLFLMTPFPFTFSATLFLSLWCLYLSLQSWDILTENPLLYCNIMEGFLQFGENYSVKMNKYKKNRIFNAEHTVQ